MSVWRHRNTKIKRNTVFGIRHILHRHTSLPYLGVSTTREYNHHAIKRKPESSPVLNESNFPTNKLLPALPKKTPKPYIHRTRIKRTKQHVSQIFPFAIKKNKTTPNFGGKPYLKRFYNDRARNMRSKHCHHYCLLMLKPPTCANEKQIKTKILNSKASLHTVRKH